MEKVRVRFAPSPTGALHIGGMRTALYNYLFARQNQGVFVLRIEDTDQNRYVPGAEAYIIESLEWCGLTPDEGPGFGGDFGPYRQSERQEIYAQYARLLVDRGEAYYAFDTPGELEARREAEKALGNHGWKYDALSRGQMCNSLTLPAAETERLLAAGTPYVIRLKVAPGEEVMINDEIRGEVIFKTDELDDKVLFKADGMPTYHLANIVDDHLMKITHVIRGEEWLPSTAHHVLLYRAFGWEDTMPVFAHLPLILKPSGNGKLSKRDGVKLGIPVFPISWKGENPEDSFTGFREFGFDPRAVLNFLALLGWSPGTDQEIFPMEELIGAFSIDKISKSGARFDFDKARWFNQQYLMHTDDASLARMVRPLIEARGHHPSEDFLRTFCHLMKERVVLLTDFWDNGYYFFEEVHDYDEKTIAKKWSPERHRQFLQLADVLAGSSSFQAEAIKAGVEGFIERQELKFGDVLPLLRMAVSGTTKGPAVFEMMELLGREEVVRRIRGACARFDHIAV